MRQTFFDALEELAQADDRIYLLTGDLGFKLFDRFRAAHPERFINAGIAEQNMVGLAAGLAMSGMNVYCYSIAPFLTMRAYEQIRLDIAYHGLNVKLVGVGGGFTYGFEGMSHFGIEDLSLMRSLPNMSVVVPAGPAEARLAALAANEYPGPLYVRLGKNGEPDVHGSAPHFRIGMGTVLAEGKDAAVIAIGSMVHEARNAVAALAKRGVRATLVNMHTLKPLDARLVLECASGHGALFTVEEHALAGGLGSAVAEVLAEASYGGIFGRIGIPDRLAAGVGDASYQRKKYGLTAEGIAAYILMELEQKNRSERGHHGLESQIRRLSQAV